MSTGSPCATERPSLAVGAGRGRQPPPLAGLRVHLALHGGGRDARAHFPRGAGSGKTGAAPAVARL